MGRKKSEKNYHQGKFTPQNISKYIGDPNEIYYRSSWELKFMKWCDQNPSVLEYGSEEFFIPYVSPVDKKYHRYFPDFIIKVKESTGVIKTYVIEVKPDKQTRPPVKKKNVTKSFLYETRMYAVNCAKWKAAKSWCADRRLEFKIITEKQLFADK